MSLHPCLLANESCPVFPPPASFVQDKQQNQVWGLELMSCLIFTSSLTVVHCKGSSRDSSIQTSLVIYGYVCVGLVHSCVVCVRVSCSRVCFASVRCLLIFLGVCVPYFCVSLCLCFVCFVSCCSLLGVLLPCGGFCVLVWCCVSFVWCCVFVCCSLFLCASCV